MSFATARAKLGGMRPPQLVFFRTLPRLVFWFLLPAPVTVGRVYRPSVQEVCPSVQANGQTRKNSSIKWKVVAICSVETEGTKF